MPRAKAPLKRNLLKQELADMLGVDVADILTRPQVVSELGEELGYTNEKSLSNADDLLVPCFYLAPLGRNGWALYSRRDLWFWVHDKAVRQTMENLGGKGRPYPWPTPAPGTLRPRPAAKSGQEVALDLLTDDQAYKDKVLGRRPWS
jgi:hypothetical protein